MTRNKLALLMALILGVGAIAGGIVYAQESSTAPLALDDQEPTTADRTFSIMLGDGAFLGVGTEDITKENMSRYGLREVRGVGVTQVVKDSPAEKAGLKKDDVILRYDGESVTSARKLSRLVGESSADQNVRITISRGGAEQDVSATLSKHNMSGLFGAAIRDGVLRDLQKEMPQMKDFPPMNGDGNFVYLLGGNRRIGVGTQTLTKQLADYFGAKDGGVLITSVSENSPAAKAGLKAGDVITAVDGEKVESSGDVSRLVNKKQDGDVSLTILRDRNTRTVTLTPEKREPAIVRPGTIGSRRVTIPSIQVPAVPAINIQIPRIVVPATPSIDVIVPQRAPRARSGARVIII